MAETVMLGVVGVLLIGKVAWNVALPYTMMLRARRAKEPITGGVSLALFVEWTLLAVAIGVATEAESWGPARVAIIGGGAIIASYVHLFVVALVSRWIASKSSHG